MPPGLGGLQVVIDGAEPMYRDIRRSGVNGWYKVRVEGLTPGAKYSLKFTLDKGALPWFGLQTQTGGRYNQMAPGGVHTFTASSTTQSFGIWLPGGFQ